MTVATAPVPLVDQLQPWPADPPEDQQPAAHCPDEAEKFPGFCRETAQQLGSRQKFEHFCVILAPEPAVAVNGIAVSAMAKWLSPIPSSAVRYMRRTRNSAAATVSVGIAVT
jgi:hypothetical protein